MTTARQSTPSIHFVKSKACVLFPSNASVISTSDDGRRKPAMQSSGIRIQR